MLSHLSEMVSKLEHLLTIYYKRHLAFVFCLCMAKQIVRRMFVASVGSEQSKPVITVTYLFF